MESSKWFMFGDKPKRPAQWIVAIDGLSDDDYDVLDTRVTRALEAWLERDTSDLRISLPGYEGDFIVKFPARIGHVLESATYGPLNVKLYAQVTTLDDIEVGKVVRNYARDAGDWDSAPRIFPKGRTPFPSTMFTWQYENVPARKRGYGEFSEAESYMIERWIREPTHRHDVILFPEDNDSPATYTVLKYPADGKFITDGRFKLEAVDYVYTPGSEMRLPMQRKVAIYGVSPDYREGPQDMDLTECRVCGSVQNLAQCGGCNKVAYCGAACQRKDWDTHAPKCKT